IALFDEITGSPLAVMDGTYITAIRTGGTAAVAARVLARDDARVLAILGAGVQGLAHLETFPRIRDFKEIRIASRNADRAKDLAKRSLHARAVESFEDAVRGADVVACCRDSTRSMSPRSARSSRRRSLVVAPTTRSPCTSRPASPSRTPRPHALFSTEPARWEQGLASRSRSR